MLYQMLSGSVPFDAANPMDILVQHLQHPPEPLEVRAPGLEIPASLDHLVMRCMAKAPVDRYRSMQEVIEGLRAVARDVGLRAEPTLGNLSMQPSAPNDTHAGSAAPQLRLNAMEATPSGTRVRPAPTAAPASRPSAAAPQRERSSGNGVWIALGLLMVLAAGAGAFVLTGGKLGATAPEAVPPPPAAAAPAALAEEQQQAELEAEAVRPAEPDMVISEEDKAALAGDALPKVEITARSVPDEALVIIRGKRMGRTPVTFEWQSEYAERGRTLTVRFRKEGHDTAVVRQTIDADELIVDAVLTPLVVRDQAELSPEEALEKLEARARDLEKAAGPAPLEVTPKPASPPPASASDDPAPSGEPVLQIKPKAWPEVGDDAVGDDAADDEAADDDDAADDAE
jgi:serine/threonine-protein kinase